MIFFSLGCHPVHYFRHVWYLHVVFPAVSRANFAGLCAHGHFCLHVVSCHHGNVTAASGDNWTQRGWSLFLFKSWSLFNYQTTSNQSLLFERSVNKNRTSCFNRLKECCVVNNLLISSSQNTEVLKRKLKIRNNLHLTSIRTTNFLRESQCACVISRAYFCSSRVALRREGRRPLAVSVTRP